MISAACTKDFGVLATDSAMFDTKQSRTSFEAIKLYYTPNYLTTFIGTPVYFANMDKTKFTLDFISLTVYLEEYLKGQKDRVEKILKSEIADPDENKPYFCMFVMGVHKKLPTMVQFNSFLGFKPKYLYSSNDVKFSSIIYGDDNPEKKKIFLETKQYMEKKALKFKKRGIELTPGIVGEILTRGIYHKADAEMAIGDMKKYAGGIVNAAVVFPSGQMMPLSGSIGV